MKAAIAKLGAATAAGLRPLSRLSLVAALFGNSKSFRRIHGGKWFRVYVDLPVCAVCWLPVPDRATHGYREPGWRGTPIVEVWP